MGYEIEMSFNLKKQTLNSTPNIVSKTVEIANKNQCNRHFQFTDYNGSNRQLKKHGHILIFCFNDDKFDGMTQFLKEITERYKKKAIIESIYEIQNHRLIYASSYYMNIIDKDTQEDYRHRRQTRSYSETDYFIIRDILNKNC